MVRDCSGPKTPTFFSIPEMRYQSAYVYLVFVSALDIVLTGLVLYRWNGDEVNPIAAEIIRQMGFGWALLFKFGMMLVAVIVCEVIGRRSDRVGRRLAVAAVIINGLPVVYTLVVLALEQLPAGPIETTELVS